MQAVMDRLMARREVTERGCWVWLGSIRPDGYGQISVGPRATRRVARVHRVAYEELVGPIPQGLTLDHLCRVTACFNPQHLEPVTAEENLRRQASASKTVCVRNHDYTPANTGINPTNGRRFCRECKRENDRRYAAKRSA